MRPASPRAFEYSFLFHVPWRRSSDVVGNAPVEREHQAERKLRDRRRVLPGTVRDDDPVRGRRGDVDRVHAGAGADDELERRRHGRRADLRRSHDQDLGRRSSHGIGERLILQLRLEQHVAAQSFQPVDAAFLELVGDENAHDGRILYENLSKHCRNDSSEKRASVRRVRQVRGT